MYCTTTPATKATTTEMRMPDTMARAFWLLMKSPSWESRMSEVEILMRAAATAPPSSSKTMDTVVEVGRPMELKASSSRTSVIITAKKMMMISLKVNISGLKTPLRAISIMPLEKVEPSSTPMLATTMMTLKLAMREPMAELRKLTASLLTPTKRSTAARMARNTSMSRKMLSTSRLLRNSLRMRHILCRQVLLQICDGGGAIQGREGLEGSVVEIILQDRAGCRRISAASPVCPSCLQGHATGL